MKDRFHCILKNPLNYLGRAVVILWMMTIFLTSAKAQNLDLDGKKLPEVYTTENGAIDGYDPVAFFTENKPVLGSKEISYIWNNADWHFATPEHLENFKSNPEKYAPQYGGYCVYGTASGHKSPTIPETWAIINNKLYFNYNLPVQKLFNKNQRGLIQQADNRWPVVKTQ